MKRGTCVKCGQSEVFAAVDGVSPGTNPPGLQWMIAGSYIAVTTYGCTSCGYLENYADPGVLVGAMGGWRKVEAQS